MASDTVISTSSHTYQYGALPTGTIRVVAIEPDHGYAPINVQLYEVSMEEAASVEYTALSYMWGSPQDPKTIYCQGEPIYVTVNLYEALQALRQLDTYRVMWIDQITINQRDNEEKSEQVRMMGQVYSNAKEVLVWLSKSIWEDTQLADPLRAFGQFAMDLNSHLIQAKPYTLPSKNAWSAVYTVLSCGYLRRVWMLQEVVRAKVAYAMLSGQRFPWQVIELCAWVLQYHMKEISLDSEHAGLVQLPGDLRPHTRSGNVMFLLHFRLNGPIGETMKENEADFPDNKWSLLDLVQKTARFDATDPRDKVYGVLGLLEFNDFCLPSAIVPRYSQNDTLEHVYRQVFVEGLVQGKLDTLAHCTPLTSNTCPSWMGGWRIQWDWDHTWTEIGKHFYSAGGRSPRVQKVEGDSNALSFRITAGWRVSACHEPYPNARHDLRLGSENLNRDFFIQLSMDPEKLVEYFYSCAKFYQDMCRPPQGEGFWEDVFRAFFCDSTVSDSPDIGRHGIRIGVEEPGIKGQWPKSIPPSDVVRSRIERLVEFWDRLLVKVGDDLPWDKEIQGINQLYRNIRDMKLGCATLDRNALHQYSETGQAGAEFNSEDGKRNIWCWLPVQAEVGDVICIVHGFHLPMIIRKGPAKTWKFFSFCYVHGYMDGEALSDEQLATEDIIFA
ncbi:unnamed protein product [Clonostachys rosea]|uniref:Heterokaryon incompatibility domain-containing protein n=1 Tax=Bionectria ochroleuca TaxID=29856 RepID=A0ABY6U973_BIOOC|nr:unnamed protein product [Clonostachys rosea]